MKKRFLHFYDKVIIAALIGALGLISCCRKTYPEKKQEQAESKLDSLKNADTIRIIRDRFDNNPIAMYGVRPTENIK